MSTITCTSSPYSCPTGRIHLSPVFDFSIPATMGGRFAFARIKGDICLVQCTFSAYVSPNCHLNHCIVSPSGNASAHSAVNVKIFRHEFITIFRYSHSDTVHPSDIRILESIDEEFTRYEEENGTVFLAKDLMERLRSMTDRRGMTQRRRISQPTMSNVSRIRR